MRPVRLELEGFTAFRDRTVIELDGADLFALCGPTGAGKTSVIDAITFALYGSVPRLDDMRQVAPVISQGKVEARVRLDFTVGAEPYTAVRVVRATKTGATTKEARLEHGDEVLAGDADDLTKQIGELLGLDFRQFTTCVSLPQGEFARFLHDKPRDRQDLLVRLLDLGLYEQVAQLASQRRTLAHDRATIATGRLEQLRGITPEAAAAASTRVDALTALRAQVDAAQPELDALAAQAAESTARAQAANERVALLDRVRVPDDVASLAAAVADAVAARQAADDADAIALDAVAAAEAARAALPVAADLEAVLDQRARHDELERQIERGTEAASAAAVADAEAAAALERAEAALAAAAEEVASATTAHLAHALAAELVVGEPCPVCEQVVIAPPKAPPADVDLAKRRLAGAEKAVVAARKAATSATTERARVDDKLASVREQVAQLVAALESAPADDAVREQLEAIARADAEVEAAKRTSTATRRARLAAAAAADDAVKAEVAARQVFEAVRDAIAVLSPPAPERVDLAADWRQLTEWVSERRPAAVEEASNERERAARASEAHTVLVRSVADACRALDVEPSPSAHDGVVAALARAEADHARLAAALGDVDRLRVDQAAAQEDEAVAHSLAGHLAANRFEQWLLDEALQQLVARASEILRSLSLDAYSLAIDAKSRAFTVVDHVNADNVRAARTLSGGETFLASLALALALADEVAAMASGAARLETILLDEGFGTLDPDTLEVVATALEELGASGRTVGIVTHVRELAERLPVRFEVTKVGGASSIVRIDS